MTGKAVRGPTYGELIRISERDGRWQQVRVDLTRHGVAVLYARLADWRPDRAAGPRLRALLGRDWARYLDLTHPDVRRRFAASRVLLKYAAYQVLDVPPDSVELGYGATGRPYLRGYDAVDISLSHTDDLLLVGLTTRGVIGVDAERADRPMYSTGLGKHVCTPHELDLLEGLDPAERDDALVRVWTLKEAYSKARGLGMQFRFTEFGFRPGSDPTGLDRPDGEPGTGTEWSFRTYVVDEDYIVSVAVGDAGFGGTDDTAASSMLDGGFVDMLTEVLGGDDPQDEEDPWDTW